MKGKSYIAKNRELAFRVYAEEGGNVEGTLRTLDKKHGLKLSKPTFYEWMKKFNFEERLKNLDAERQKTMDSQISFEEKMMNSLIERKEAYEEYFKNNPMDHQAQYAYAGIIKSIFDIRSKTAGFKTAMFIEHMKELIIFLTKNDPEAAQVLERNFDALIAFAKEKYA